MLQGDDGGILKVFWGFIVTVVSAVAGWTHLRINRLDERMVTKAEFRAVQRLQDERNSTLLRVCEENKHTTEKIWEKLDGKQDRA